VEKKDIIFHIADRLVERINRGYGDPLWGRATYDLFSIDEKVGEGSGLF
jgi:hypothetical protein